MLSGMLCIYKEAGFTSNDVVAKLRGIVHMRKIGHTGTLDPMAEGVLPVCLGPATRLCDMIADRDKVYECRLKLGVRTDTQDMTGQVLSEADPQAVMALTEDRIREAAASFVGDYDQVPPMYSALKVGGKKLYELARAGKTVERKPRRIRIHALEVLSVDLPYVRIRVACSKGTYIRTLCEDLGGKLGTGGAMDYLLRTRVGIFDLKDAIRLSEAEALMKEDPRLLEERIIPIDAFFGDCPAAEAAPEAMRFLLNGNALKRSQLRFPGGERPAPGTRVRVYDREGSFYAVYEAGRDGRYTPVRMFLPADR